MFVIVFKYHVSHWKKTFFDFHTEKNCKKKRKKTNMMNNYIIQNTSRPHPV